MQSAALLVEILSPAMRQARITIPSVREILAVHSTRIEAELLRRSTDGNWPAEPDILTASDTLTLDTIGFATPLAAFYRTTALAS